MNPPALPAGPLIDDATHLMARLQRYPQLYEQVAALLDEVENRAGALNTGDEAEDAIVERMRQFGGCALTQWAEQRHSAVQPARTAGLRQVGKKTLLANDLWSHRVDRTALAERYAHAATVLRRHPD